MIMIIIIIYEQIKKACGANYFYFGKFGYCVGEVQPRQTYAKRKTLGETLPLCKGRQICCISTRVFYVIAASIEYEEKELLTKSN